MVSLIEWYCSMRDFWVSGSEGFFLKKLYMGGSL
jgi:hypothetical protein